MITTRPVLHTDHSTLTLPFISILPYIGLSYTTSVKVNVHRNRPEGPEGSRGIDLLFLDLGVRRGGWSAQCSGRFTPGKDPVQEAGWTPGPIWTCAKNLASTGIRSPDRPARSQSYATPVPA
jgi:hypothetical protein